jgi:oligosaccharyltransferase complex subunit alpha (ribophorin I)
MKFLAGAAACLSLLAPQLVAAASSSKVILPSTFKPPQVFRNANLVHIISLEKNYAKESINVVIENSSGEPQDEYYLPFTSEQMEKLGGIEVRDKKDEVPVNFAVDAVEFDPSSDTQYYRIQLPFPLPPRNQQTLSISLYYLRAFAPLPAAIEQTDKQYLVYSFSAYCNSAYVTLKQKTELKLPSSDVPDYTKIAGSGKNNEEFPQKQGSKLTYGPFAELPAGASSPAKVRFEFTKPVLQVSHFERDIEVSHWGGNIAFEERYTLYNKAANLSSQFNRVKWAQSAYFSPATTALKEMKFSLKAGSRDVYYTDVIGNVSTSSFRSNQREASLDIKPRYPVFGGWKYPFTVGWNAAAKSFLKRSGDSYLLKVPFLEGPRQSEGVQYEHVQLRVLLPEGADNVKFHTSIPASSIIEHGVDLQLTYLDTIGRTVLTIKARNLVDDFRGRDIIISYDYTLFASLRKPFVIFSSMMAVFVGIWAISKVEVKFSTKR